MTNLDSVTDCCRAAAVLAELSPKDSFDLGRYTAQLIKDQDTNKFRQRVGILFSSLN